MSHETTFLKENFQALYLSLFQIVIKKWAPETVTVHFLSVV